MNASLVQLQNAFQQHLLHGTALIASQIVADAGLTPERRLHIYHDGYRARLVDTLRDTFGHTARYLGDEWFDADALAYAQTHASTHTSLNDYGAGFATWCLQRHVQDADIGELAALDWALRRAFDGLDAKPLSLQDLAHIAPEAWAHIGFAVVPTCTRLRFTYNTLALWQALDDEQQPPPATRLAAPVEVRVWRRGHSPHFRSLGALESAALLALQGGASFAALCEQLSEQMSEQFADSDVPAQAGALLRRWVDEELLCAVIDSA